MIVAKALVDPGECRSAGIVLEDSFDDPKFSPRYLANGFFDTSCFQRYCCFIGLVRDSRDVDIMGKILVFTRFVKEKIVDGMDIELSELRVKLGGDFWC